MAQLRRRWRPAAFLAALMAAVAAAQSSAGQTCDVVPKKDRNCSGPSSQRDLLDGPLAPSVYDTTQRPLCEEDVPTVVEVQIRMTQLNSVDQKLGVVSISGYLRMYWRDPRLAFPGVEAGGCVDSITMSGEDLDKAMWVPDVYLDNGVDKQVDTTAIIVNSNGAIFRTEQVRLETANMLDFGRVPYDEHVAKFTFVSATQDISQLRIVPKGGTVGPGVSGAAVVAPAMVNKLWMLPEGTEEKGFETAGSTEVVDGRDLMTASFDYKRRPKFLIDQVILPSILFLVVSYIQFWVDAAAAPARAALACIPVVIMCALSDSVYRFMPQTSEQLWLIDNVFFFTFMCTLAALEFGVVQHALIVERSRARKRDGLMKVQDHAQALITTAHAEGTSLLELVNHCSKTRQEGEEAAPAEPDASAASTAVEQREITNLSASSGSASTADRVADASAASTAVGQREITNLSASSGGATLRSATTMDRMTFVASAEAVRRGIKECDLLVIAYTKSIFELYDWNHSSTLTSNEVRQAFTYFDIYLSKVQTPKVICMFLRDQGEATPPNEKDVELPFGYFLGLLLTIDKYRLSHKTGSIPCYIQSIAPGKRWDVAARIVFPIVIVTHQIVMQHIIDRY